MSPATRRIIQQYEPQKPLGVELDHHLQRLKIVLFVRGVLVDDEQVRVRAIVEARDDEAQVEL